MATWRGCFWTMWAHPIHPIFPNSPYRTSSPLCLKFISTESSLMVLRGDYLTILTALQAILHSFTIQGWNSSWCAMNSFFCVTYLWIDDGWTKGLLIEFANTAQYKDLAFDVPIPIHLLYCIYVSAFLIPPISPVLLPYPYYLTASTVL